MSTEHHTLEGFIGDFIRRQPMFFVATAAADGLVNVSPKGGVGTLVVLDDRRVAYLDLTGSGSEAIAHVRSVNRITVMWCAFEGPPMIVRVHGTAQVLTPATPDWDAMSAHFPDKPGARAIIVVTADRISDSCGMSVPLLDYRSDRDQLDRWARGKGPNGLREYRDRKNAISLDGLPALEEHERG
ncbi:pyridoxamine 5'-phosphate oxidase family protein [Demequina globuliformis]|uniref:pyridoxamine 5'-phosphate oxidase family protein n=1 Tax=Demequina globuliformis TaxID=676202 RepID=UPI000780EAAD|nr:pyridoxamine 5'-phosphate oxidase family protein [Demequina globuliformis]